METSDENLDRIEYDWEDPKKISLLTAEKHAMLQLLVQEHSILPWSGIFGNDHRERLAKYYLEQWEGRGVEVIFAPEASESHLAAVGIEALGWDSNLLGMSCARLYPISSPTSIQEDSTERDILFLGAVVEYLTEREIDLADMKVSTSDLFLMRALAFCGFHAVDVLLTLGAKKKKLHEIVGAHSESFKVIDQDSITFGSGVTVRPIQAGELAKMELLAREAFSDTAAIKDRFYLEPSILHERANDLFLEWFRNSVRKQESGKGVVLVAEKSGATLGFLTMDAPMHPALGGYWQDSLNAVSESARGQGVYRSLVIAAMRYALEHGGEGLITRTQVSTNRVINSWLHLGTDLYESFVTLHWTPTV